MDELNIIHDQLKRMRSMNKFYHHQFLIDVRIFFILGLIGLISTLINTKIAYVLPFLSLFGSVLLAFHAYYLIFSRHYSEYLEKNINKISFIENKVLIPSFNETWNDVFSPIFMSIPAQLIAYHVARERGTDVDQPRNLAKSVTVE